MKEDGRSKGVNFRRERNHGMVRNSTGERMIYVLTMERSIATTARAYELACVRRSVTTNVQPPARQWGLTKCVRSLRLADADQFYCCDSASHHQHMQSARLFTILKQIKIEISSHIFPCRFLMENYEFVRHLFC